MVREYQRKHEVLDPKKLRSALSVVQRGASVRSAAKYFGINHQTLRRYWKVHKASEGEFGSSVIPVDPAKCGRATLFSEDQEDALKNYLMNYPDDPDSFVLTVEYVRRLAFHFAQELGISTPPWNRKQMAGIDWFYGFRKRHPDLAIRMPEAFTFIKVSFFFSKFSFSFLIN